MKGREKPVLSLSRRELMLMTLGALLPGPASARPQVNRQNLATHSRTDWQVSPSFTFDVLCLLNVLTGDPFYVPYYKQEYARLSALLTPRARAALADLKRKLKDENKNIVSAFLCLYFSATDAQTLDDLLETLEHSERMKNTLKTTVYFDERGWRLYESVRGDLRTIFRFLREIGFADYWKQTVLPKIQPKITAVSRDLASYNVVTEIETYLGFVLPSDTVTVYVLYYAQPHGIRVT